MTNSTSSAHPEAAMLVGRALRRSVSAEDRALFERTNQEIHRLKADLAAHRFELGQRLNLILERNLYRAGGYATFEHYLEQEVAVARSTAYMTMRVARTFGLDVARRFGMDKLEAILEYVEATPAQEKVEEILTLRLRAGGKEKPIGRATIREIESATQAVRQRRAARSRAALPAPLRALFVRLRRSFERDEGLKRVGVSVEPAGKGGEAVLSFTRIPVGRAAEFARLLQRQIDGPG